jgi:hypothetical protein
MTRAVRPPDAEFEVVNNALESRYEARAPGGDVIGVAEYRRRAIPEGTRIVFPHTFVPPELEGHGIAAALARRALDDARAEGARIVPACWFIDGYISRHPEYKDLVER